MNDHPTITQTPPSHHDVLSPSELVVRAVSDTLGAAPTEIPPLFETLDPDALDALIEHATDTAVTIAFEYAGLQVTVDADGTVSVDGDRTATADDTAVLSGERADLDSPARSADHFL